MQLPHLTPGCGASGAPADEVAALPLLGDAAALQDTLTQINSTLARMDTTQRAHTTALAGIDTALARMETTLNAHTTTLNAHTTTLNAHTTALARLELRTAVAYNATCGEGVSRQYVQVPNAAGALPSQQLRAVRTAADFRGLTASQTAALATFYGIALGGARKEELKHRLGLSFP